MRYLDSGSLRDVAEKLLEENRSKNNGPDSVSQFFVGTDEIMLKTTNLDGIKHYSTLEGNGTVLLPSTYPTIARSMTRGNSTDIDDKILLPKIQIVVATKSAEAGINGKHLVFGKVSGIPASLYELVQQMGRVDRVGTDEPGSNTYEVHIDLDSCVSLYVHIMKCELRKNGNCN